MATGRSQTLISPLIFSPAPEEAATLLEHAAELEQIGFDLSDFGVGTIFDLPGHHSPGHRLQLLPAVFPASLNGRLAGHGVVNEF